MRMIIEAGLRTVPVAANRSDGEFKELGLRLLEGRSPTYEAQRSAI